MVNEFLIKAFISLFVSIDVVGALPLVMGLTRTLNEIERIKIIRKATAAALLIGVIFIFAGRFIFSFLGITENDFRVAGGLLLLIFAIRDLTSASVHQGSPIPTGMGIVPIAIPIIMGPAALATVMLGTKEFGLLITLCALVINLLIVWALFSRAGKIVEKIGAEVSDAMAKISALLLAAIAVMLIRIGIKGML